MQQLTSNVSWEDFNTSKRQPTSTGSPDGNNHVLGAHLATLTMLLSTSTTHLLLLLFVIGQAAAHHAAVTPGSSSSNSSSSNGVGHDAGFERFLAAVKGGANLVPLSKRIFSDHLTPVSAYRWVALGWCVLPWSDQGAAEGGGRERSMVSVSTAGSDALNYFPCALRFDRRAPGPCPRSV